MTDYDEEQLIRRDQIKATKELNETLKDLNRTLVQIVGQLKVR